MDPQINALRAKLQEAVDARAAAVEQMSKQTGAKIEIASPAALDEQIATLRSKLDEAVNAREDAKFKLSQSATPLKIGVDPAQLDAEVTKYKAMLDRAIELRDEAVKRIGEKTAPVDIGIDQTQLNQQIADLEANLKEAVRLKTDASEQLSRIAALPSGGLAGGINEDLQALRDYVSQLDTSFQSVEQKQQTLQQFSDVESEWREKIEQSNLSLEQRNELLNAMNQFHQELADGITLVGDQVERSKEQIDENSKYVQKLSNDITDLSQRAQNMTLGKSWTGEAERMREAGDGIADIIGDIKLKIEEIQQAQANGLITPETANAAIANLNAIASAVEGSKGRIINAASDINQAWQQMGREIYSAIESALGDAIYNLVTGAKSMKDVLLDLWKSVTRAVSNYIAKLLMAGLFGGGDAGGGIFGSLFGSHTGSQLSFASGGSAMVDGRTGFDKNMVSMRVSRGERVTVETAAQQKANDHIRGGAIYNIYALDGNSVEQMLLRHGGVLKSAIEGRVRLNR
jgi:chromosome segregation ATPase